MTVYSTPSYANNAPIRVHGESHNVQFARFTITTTAVLTTADTFNFGYVPAGARLLGGYLAPSDLDASTGLTLSIGDAGSATRLFSASTAGQAGTYTLIPAAALDYQWTDKTAIVGSVGANATTTASGTITLVLIYSVQEPASTVI